MRIPKKIKSLSEVDTNLQVFYVEDADSGEFTLRDDQITATAISVLSGQQAVIERLRNENKSAKDSAVDLSALSEFGSDPATIAESVKAKIEELTSKASHGQQEVAARIDTIKKQHAEALAAANSNHETELGKARSELHSYMMDTSVMAAATTWPGLSPKLVAPFVRQQMQVQEIDGKPQVVVVDANGQPRYSKTTERAGELMRPDELLMEMSGQDEYRQLFPSKQASQGGGAHTRQTPLAPRKGDTKNMTPADKISAGIAAGLAGKPGRRD